MSSILKIYEKTNKNKTISTSHRETHTMKHNTTFSINQKKNKKKHK